jgi:hypothetical protein
MSSLIGCISEKMGHCPSIPAHSQQREACFRPPQCYLRVSTGRQGRSGLGLDAQRKAVEDFLNGGSWELAKEYVEVESGKKTDRPVLAEALKACRLYGAKLVHRKD